MPEFFGRIAASDAEEPSWVLLGLGSRPRILRVVSDGTDPDGVACVRVYHTGPEWASGVVALEGFIVSGTKEIRPWEE